MYDLTQNLRKSNAAASVTIDNSEGLQQLALEILQCFKCPALVKSRTFPVCGFGDTHPTVLFLGEAPGRFGADTYGIPFVGDKSGMLLQRMMRLIGLSLSPEESILPRLTRAYVTNIVKCNPRGSDNKNRSPSRLEIENCGGYLERELVMLNPKVIVPLGRKPTEKLLGNATKQRFYHPIKHRDWIVFPMHHPAFIARGGGVSRFTEREYGAQFRVLGQLIATLDGVEDEIPRIHR